MKAESCKGRSWWKAELRDPSFLAALNIERREKSRSIGSVPNRVQERSVQ
jgi:hypothetical protein